MSLPEDNQQLRKLSRAVMRGELSRAEYQQQRRRMIDRYTGDTGAADDTDNTDPGTRPAVEVADLTQPVQPRATAKKPATPAAAPAIPAAQGAAADHGDLWVGLVAVVGVILVVAGVLAYFW